MLTLGAGNGFYENSYIDFDGFHAMVSELAVHGFVATPTLRGIREAVSTHQSSEVMREALSPIPFELTANPFLR